MTIDAPGIYMDVDPSEYHGDPMPAPSFTQSLAKVLLSHSPAHARLKSPSLSPPADDDEAEKYVKARVIGDAAHLLMLGRGKRLEVFDAADWNASGGGKGAKTKLLEARDDAVAAGKLPILAKHFEIAERMRNRAWQQLEHYDLDIRSIGAEAGGNAEVMVAWQRDGLWCRSLIDWLTFDRLAVIDYKSTTLCAAPQSLDKLMADAGWAIQAAMHRDGLDTVDPDNAGRRRHIFIAQEQYEPFELTVSQLPESTLTMGRKLLDMAWDRWRAAMRSGRWNGYPRVVQMPRYPEWQENRILEREIADAEERDQDRRRGPVADDLVYSG